MTETKAASIVVNTEDAKEREHLHGDHAGGFYYDGEPDPPKILNL